MNLDDDEVWRNGMRDAETRGQRARNILLLFVLGPTVVRLLMGDILAALIELAIVTAVMACLLRPPSTAALTDLGEERPLFVELRQEIHDIGKALGLHRSLLHLKLNAANFGANPHIRGPRAGRLLGLARPAPVFLEIPLGFLKFYQEDRAAARAILAHELAHMRHQDWELWTFASAATAFIKWLSIPVAIVTAMTGVASELDVHRFASERHLASVDAYRQQKYLRDARGDTGRALEIAAAHAARDAQERQSKMDESALVREDRASRLLAAALPLSFRILLVLSILRLRKKSEAAADHLAALVTSPRDLMRALARFGEPRPWWKILSAHPSLRVRLRALQQRCPASTEELAPKPGKTGPPGSIVATLTGRTGIAAWLDNPQAGVRRFRRVGLFVSLLCAEPLGSLVHWCIHSTLSTWISSPLPVSASLDGLAFASIVLIVHRLIRRGILPQLISALLGGTVFYMMAIAYRWSMAMDLEIGWYDFFYRFPTHFAEAFALLLAFSWALSRGRSETAAFGLAVGCSFVIGWLATVANPALWNSPLREEFGPRVRLLLSLDIARLMVFWLVFGLRQEWARSRSARLGRIRQRSNGINGVVGKPDRSS